MRRGALALVLASLLLTPVAATGAPPDAERLVTDALARRDARDWPGAISLLERAVAIAPEERPLVLLGETLSWARRFHEAEEVLRRALARWPASREASVALARVLLWDARPRDARALLEGALARSPRDVEARELLATAAYWSGDLRAAAATYRAVLAAEPGRFESAKSLLEIESAAAPLARVDVRFRSDDQPFRVAGGEVAGSLFSDPLTRWDAAIGAWRLEDPDRGAVAHAPYARAGVDVTVPSASLLLQASLGALRFPDGVTRALPAFAAQLSLGRSLSATASVAWRELFGAAASLDAHPSVAEYGTALRLETPSKWLAAVEAKGLSYVDGNRGVSLSVWALVPVVVRPVTLRAGLAASYRDTAEQRFRVAHLDSVFVQPGLFTYRFVLAYDPYWTPSDLAEVRLVASLEAAPARGLTLSAHADGGWARDRAPAFGPESGPQSAPSSTFLVFYTRTFRPWRISLDASLAAGRFTVRAGAARESTVFYAADEFHAGLVGRF